MLRRSAVVALLVSGLLGCGSSSDPDRPDALDVTGEVAFVNADIDVSASGRVVAGWLHPDGKGSFESVVRLGTTGGRFSERQKLSTGGPTARPAVVVGVDGTAVAAFGENERVRTAWASPGGAFRAPGDIGPLNPENPDLRLVAAGEGRFVLVWHDTAGSVLAAVGREGSFGAGQLISPGGDPSVTVAPDGTVHVLVGSVLATLAVGASRFERGDLPLPSGAETTGVFTGPGSPLLIGYAVTRGNTTRLEIQSFEDGLLGSRRVVASMPRDAYEGLAPFDVLVSRSGALTATYSEIDASGDDVAVALKTATAGPGGGAFGKPATLFAQDDAGVSFPESVEVAGRSYLAWGSRFEDVRVATRTGQGAFRTRVVGSGSQALVKVIAAGPRVYVAWTSGRRGRLTRVG